MNEKTGKVMFGIAGNDGKIEQIFETDKTAIGTVEASIKQVRNVSIIQVAYIPKFVAKYVTLFNSKYEMTGIELLTFKDKDVPENIEKWLSSDVENANKLISAIMYGYEVEDD